MNDVYASIKLGQSQGGEGSIFEKFQGVPNF